ncbi:hypothetical protein DPEC_G00109540 [Dallia pectoralis]|uniref:Uncharacterized protein n=1 Tax=Dallia pectoralis TaxID=75939 RepID=A0ACC2GSK5_DALPE|nr:hypothetical protein DPEC_G00109540 [Dallia pectoralis]
MSRPQPQPVSGCHLIHTSNQAALPGSCPAPSQSAYPHSKSRLHPPQPQSSHLYPLFSLSVSGHLTHSLCVPSCFHHTLGAGSGYSFVPILQLKPSLAFVSQFWRQWSQEPHLSHILPACN